MPIKKSETVNSKSTTAIISNKKSHTLYKPRIRKYNPPKKCIPVNANISEKIGMQTNKLADKIVNKPKITSKSRNWCFTDFEESNITNGYYKIFDENKDIIRAIAWEKEICPTTGKLHNQGIVQFLSNQRHTRIQNLINSKCHVELVKGTVEQNLKYCGKEGKLITLGKFALYQGERTDLESVINHIQKGTKLSKLAYQYPKEIVKYPRGLLLLKSLCDKKLTREFRKIKTTVMIGSAGIGKSQSIREIEGIKNCFTYDLSNQNFPLDGYDGEKVLIIDDFNGNIQYTELLRLLDGYQYKVNLKGGHTYAQWTKVYITSNKPIFMWYKNIQDNLKRRIHRLIIAVDRQHKKQHIRIYEKADKKGTPKCPNDAIGNTRSYGIMKACDKTKKEYNVWENNDIWNIYLDSITKDSKRTESNTYTTFYPTKCIC